MRQAPPDIDWNALRELRDRFLLPDPIPEPYWISREQLEAYDRTLGERIGWKWDAVVAELRARDWAPPEGELIDMGCGTGIAARRVLSAWPGRFNRVRLWDHSPIAMAFAREKIQEAFPGMRVSLESSAPRGADTVLVSHLLTELDEFHTQRLLGDLRGARAVLWVEPGTHESSRSLLAARATLLGDFQPVAPCPHAGTCGLLGEGNEAHWCHHFAPAAPGAHQDPFWGHFRREMNLDIGPVAYSFLVLAREAPPLPSSLTHLIGLPLRSPKFLRVLACCPDGDLRELIASRRSGAVYRSLKNAETPALYALELRNNRIVGGHRAGTEEGLPPQVSS